MGNVSVQVSSGKYGIGLFTFWAFDTNNNNEMAGDEKFSS